MKKDENNRAREWLTNTYQGDKVPQLTLRAVLTGMILGGVMSLSNLYVGAKTGWGLGVTITACILAYAFFSGLQWLIPALRRNHFSILENNMMSSAASSAGYMSSSIFIGAVPALYLTSQRTLDWLELSLWAAAVSFLGVFMAIPMKRQQINIDQLPFPSGIATAETLKAMHSHGGDASKRAWSLTISAAIGGVLAWFRTAKAEWMPFNIPEKWVPEITIAGQPISRLTFSADLSLTMVAAGAIMGIRVGISLLVGAIACYGLIGPYVLNNEWCHFDKYRQTWALWPGVGILVASGLTSFLLGWKTIVRAFSSLGNLFANRTEEEDPVAHIEAPQSWFLWGTGLSGLACVILGHYFFGIEWWMGVIAVVATFFLALIASRATGETDVTPTGAMGKITQLMFGLLSPGNMTTNLMTASLTGGAAIHSADLLTDLKSGYILGANPRKQLIAQLFGVVAGTVFVVPAYLLLIKPEEIGGDKWPMPAAHIWAGVAEVLAKGLSSLPPGAMTAFIIGGVVGVALELAAKFAPANIRKYMLSPTGFGIAFVVPAGNSISMFIGALIAWYIERRSKESADRYTVAVSSGIIAGETLIGVLVAALVVAGVLLAD